MAHYRKSVDTTFFDNWSAAMAYVLGYFAADGSMYVNPHGAKYIDFVSTDRPVLEQIKRLLRSEHLIAVRKRKIFKAHWKPIFRLQIGGRELFDALARRGFTANKDCTLCWPTVPGAYVADFVRGYFDGDGCISFGQYVQQGRSRASFWVQVCFVSGSLAFLSALDCALQAQACVAPGYLRRRPRGCYLYYQRRPDIRRLYQFIYYSKEFPSSLCLERKRMRFAEAVTKLSGGRISIG